MPLLDLYDDNNLTNNNSNNNNIFFYLKYIKGNKKCYKFHTTGKIFFIVSYLLTIILTMAASEDIKTFFTSESPPIFTSNLYKATAEELEGNIISSPISVHLLLSFLSHGARGKTATELIDNLLIKDVNRLPAEYKNLMSTLNSINNVELHIANSAFLHHDTELLIDFSTLGVDYYNFALSKINFQDNVNSANQINSWIMEHTNNKITDMVNSDDITDDTKMILVNAIYFKGSWKFPFDREHTTNKPFYITKNHHILVPTMTKKLRYAHGELPDMNSKFIEIPYTNDNLTMVIILPNEIEGLESLEKNFNWKSIVNAESKHHELVLHLPKFKVKSTLNLKKILNKIGIIDIFENSADFSGMTEIPVKVSKVIQKAFLEVNEEGCEAAAATIAQIRLRRMIMEPEEYLVDRPFIVAIRHKYSDIPLFIGRVNDIDIEASLPSDQRDEL